MAAGLPVVATNVGGLPELLGGTGLLAPAGDPRAVAECILRLATAPELRQQMGLLGRERALAFFDETRMIAEYEALYREMVPPANGMTG
jgi:glycosyltransferase involved in cell wall biosynthesis